MGKRGYITQRNPAHFYCSQKLTEELYFQKESTSVRNRILKYLTIGKAKAPYITVLLPMLSLTGSKQTNRDLS